MSNRLGGQQCPLQRLDRTDIGFRSAFSHEDTHAELREGDLAARTELALLLEGLQLRPCHDHHVRAFTLLDAPTRAPTVP
jgi:hypothetical protein